MENILLVAASVAVLLIAVASIPVLLQLRLTARNLAQTLQTLNQTLPAILKNLEEITTHVNRTAAIVDREVEDFSATLRKLQGTLGLIVGVEEIVRRNLNLAFVRKLRMSAAVARGARVFLEQLLSRRPAKTDCP
ncbi:MAG: DUF948 domain-containing protein [Syntrophales bacterium]